MKQPTCTSSIGIKSGCKPWFSRQAGEQGWVRMEQPLAEQKWRATRSSPDFKAWSWCAEISSPTWANSSCCTDSWSAGLVLVRLCCNCFSTDRQVALKKYTSTQSGNLAENYWIYTGKPLDWLVEMGSSWVISGYNVCQYQNKCGYWFRMGENPRIDH